MKSPTIAREIMLKTIAEEVSLLDCGKVFNIILPSDSFILSVNLSHYMNGGLLKIKFSYNKLNKMRALFRITFLPTDTECKPKEWTTQVCKQYINLNSVETISYYLFLPIEEY